MHDHARLTEYVDVWWSAITDFLILLEVVDDEDWSTRTDLAGWDVRAIASHVAHLEGILAGGPEETAEIGEPDHVTSVMGLYTEIGVVNRRAANPTALIEEIRKAAHTRHEALLADPPTDPQGSPPHIFGGIGWTWGTLLRNRPLDVWMHEQDVRRATGRAGNLDSAAARHTADYMTESFGFVLAKRAAAPPGTTAILEVAGSPTVAYSVNDDGRGVRLNDLPQRPTVHLRMDRETFTLLSGGRRAIGPEAVHVAGDPDLAETVFAAMATTP